MCAEGLKVGICVFLQLVTQFEPERWHTLLLTAAHVACGLVIECHHGYNDNVSQRVLHLWEFCGQDFA